MNESIKNNEQNHTVSNDNVTRKFFVVLAKPPDRTKVKDSSNVSSSLNIHSLKSPNKITKATSVKRGSPITVYITPSTNKNTNSSANNVQNVSQDVQHNHIVAQNKDLTFDASSNAKKLVKWNRNACLLLAETYKIYESEFTATHTRKKKVWEKISSVLNENYGLGVNPTQCENKMRSILYSRQRVSDSKKLCKTDVLKVLKGSRMEEDYIDDPSSNELPGCISFNVSQNENQQNNFPVIAENMSTYKNVKLTKRDKMKRDKDVKHLINTVMEGMERRHKEKMAKCDKMIDILGKIVDKM